MDKDLKEKFDELAKNQCRSTASLINFAMKRYLDEIEGNISTVNVNTASQQTVSEKPKSMGIMKLK